LLVETGGVGYRVQVPARVASQVKTGDSLSLWTRQIVREDAIELVGFMEESDSRLFDSLTSVSKVGPKAALSILSLAPAHEVQSQILAGNIEFISTGKGIGKKTAERLVLELKGSLEDVLEHRESQSADQEVAEALVTLGYTQREAIQAAAAVDRNLPVQERVKEALRSMNSA